MATESPEPRGTAPDVIQDFGWALGTLLRAYLRQAGEAVAELPGGPRAYQAMAIIASDSCQNQAAIAERLGLDRTVMTYLIDDLESHKLVLRTPDPNDRRARRITLTKRGASLLETLSGRVRQVERQLLAQLNDSEAEQLRATLGRAALVAEARSGEENACQIGESLNIPA
jgi:MarR family transcriptional regulator, transcriptional regulator for hemolysin